MAERWRLCHVVQFAATLKTGRVLFSGLRSYVAADELIEVTPKHIRLRKRELDEGARDVLRRKNRPKK